MERNTRTIPIEDRIILALDVDNPDVAKEWVVNRIPYPFL